MALRITERDVEGLPEHVREQIRGAESVSQSDIRRAGSHVVLTVACPPTEVIMNRAGGKMYISLRLTPQQATAAGAELLAAVAEGRTG